MQRRAKRILVLDVGGGDVKIWATGDTEPREIPSGRRMDARRMIAAVREAVQDWSYDAVSLGYPGRVHEGRPVAEPKNLGHGWLAFDYAKALGCPVRITNDAAMQALGSYEGGRMLFLGFGTGVGSTLIVDDVIVPLALGELPFRSKTVGYYLSNEGLKRLGENRWQRAVHEAVGVLRRAFEADYLVLGGGKAELIDHLPPGAKQGGNDRAFIGGCRMWQPKWDGSPRNRP